MDDQTPKAPTNGTHAEGPAEPQVTIPEKPEPDVPLLTFQLQKYAVETLPQGIVPFIILTDTREAKHVPGGGPYYYLSPLPLANAHLLISRMCRLMES